MTYEDEINSSPHEYYMRECFELAKNALGRTSPNPVVGAIVLDKKGFPVGKGYHKASGEEHAEVIALKEAGNKSEGGTLIVSLEPCCHHGKTPPCSDLILRSGIEEVIFSCYDPNPLIASKGEKVLSANGIKIVSKILEEEGHELNKFFFKWIKTRLPWITLKQAQTLDGRVALNNKHFQYISGELSRKEVHKMRNIYDAILVGAKTVQTDNPQLTVRDIPNGRNPARIILDMKLATSPSSNVYKNNATIFIVTKKGHPKDKLDEYFKYNEQIIFLELSDDKNGRLNLKTLFEELGKQNILSVLVEAGPVLAGEIYSSGLLDEYILFIAPLIAGDDAGVPSVKLSVSLGETIPLGLSLLQYQKIGNDLMVNYRNLKP